MTEQTAVDTAIVLDRVTKRFGEFVAVHDASFEIGQGEFFSMLGPSGCGKTTTLRMIAGFETPSSGRILLDGSDVSRIPPYRRNVNTVFQHYALFPHMTVWENVAFGPRSKKVPKSEIASRVASLLEVVRLGEFTSRKPSQLSGGQQQRVALARALVNYPRALLLDEPLGALDLKLRQAMQLELKRIQRDVGITFIYVTHDQEEALTMSDRIAVMNLGYVEQIGTPVEIYERPATAFVAGFIGQANLWSATVRDQSNGRAVVEALGTTLSARAETALNGATTLMVRPERIKVTVAETDAATGTSVPVTVRDLVFQGPLVRLAAEAPDGTEVVAHVGAETDLPLLHPGDRVWCTWASDAASALPGTPGAPVTADQEVSS